MYQPGFTECSVGQAEIIRNEDIEVFRWQILENRQYKIKPLPLVDAVKKLLPFGQFWRREKNTHYCALRGNEFEY